MKSAFKLGIGVLLGFLVASQLTAQDFPTLEPIPSPAADDGAAGELPPLDEPTPADPNEKLELVPETTPLTLSPQDGSDGTSDQVTYETPIVEGPFSTLDSTEGPALEPIADQSTYQDVADTPAIEFQQQPIQLQSDSIQSQQVMIESPTPSVVYESPTESTVQPIIENPIVEQRIVGQPIYSQPSYQQPTVTYQQPSVPRQTIHQRPVVICPPRTQPQTPVRTQQKVVVKSAPTPKYYYYRVDAKQPTNTRPQPARQPQQTVIIRQNVNVQPASAPKPPYGDRYYVVPQNKSQVQQAQYQQVQRVPRQAPPAARPVNYEVQVTETTQYRPVQVRVTETYQAAPRPTATIVVPAPDYVPFQPFRNAVRRRW